MRRGFSLIEILVALSVVAVVAVVAGTSLMLVLRTEQSTRSLQESIDALSRIEVAHYLERDLDAQAEELERKWIVTREEIEVGRPPTNVLWTTWTLAPRDRPSLRASISFSDPQ